MNRRFFLKGILAVTAASFIPVNKLGALSYPVLHSDGITDDTKALQALLDLKPYIVDGKLIEGQTKAVIDGGNFVVSDTLTFNNDFTSITNSKFKWSKHVDVAFCLREVDNCVIYSCYFEAPSIGTVIKTVAK